VNLRQRITAIVAFCYLTGIVVACFHRVAWKNFKDGVRGIWRTR
jgi:hypothetical protein